MVHISSGTLNSYYDFVQEHGKLRTPDHARRWSTAVLKTLGFNLDKSTKKALAHALPEPLAQDLTRVFWLLHFQNKHLTAAEFYDQVARRSGNTDIAFARHPTKAVFGGIKGLVDSQLNQRVAEALSPEMRAVWEQA